MTIQHRTVEIEAASKPWKDAICGLHRLQGASVCLPTSSLGSHFQIARCSHGSRELPNCRPHECKRAPRKDKTAMRDRKPDTVIIPPHKYDLERLPFAKRLLELRPGECIWPINDGSPFLFCAAKTAGKYCQHHQSRAVAVQRIAKREK